MISKREETVSHSRIYTLIWLVSRDIDMLHLYFEVQVSFLTSWEF